MTITTQTRNSDNRTAGKRFPVVTPAQDTAKEVNELREYHLERMARKRERPSYPSFQYCSALQQALENVGYTLYMGRCEGRYTARCFLVELTGDFQHKDIGRSIHKPRPLSPENQALLDRARARWASEPQYVVGRGGNTYPAEFVAEHPYTYGR